MAQIVKTESGYWVGKELYPNEQYISFDAVRFRHPNDKIKTVEFEEMAFDLSEKFGVSVSATTPDSVLKALAKELCSDKMGMIYLLDYKASFGVQKVIDAPI